MDSEIDEKLARAMDWERIRFADGLMKWKGSWQNGEPIEVFSPCTRWDHVGIVIEFMELEKEYSLQIEGNDIYFKKRNTHRPSCRCDKCFLNSPGCDGIARPLTPRHITLATLAALDSEGDS